MKPLSETALTPLRGRRWLLIDYLMRYGTLHRAARLLLIIQPASKAIFNDLESLPGLRLSVRSRRGVMRTLEAHSHFDKVRLALHEFGVFATTMQRLREGCDIVLRVGSARRRL